MSEIKVKSGKEADARVVSVQYDVPTTTQGLVDKYGDEQVASLAGRAVTLAIQALVRQKLAAGTADSALQGIVDAWVPGVRGPAVKKTPFERAQSALSVLSKEDMDALLADYKNKKRSK